MHGLIQVTVVDRESVRVARVDARPEREDQRVIFDCPVGLGMDRARRRVDPAELSRQQARPGVVDDRRERIAAGRGVGERLAHDHRPIDELGIGGDHGHVGPLGCEIAEGERGLQGGDAATDDDHTELVRTRAELVRTRAELVRTRGAWHVDAGVARHDCDRPCRSWWVQPCRSLWSAGPACQAAPRSCRSESSAGR